MSTVPTHHPPPWLGAPLPPRLRAVLAARLRAQHLLGEAAPDPAAAVHDALAIQSQDPLLARFSLSLRTGLADDAGVRAGLASGEVLRIHVLRPTWHFVHRDDVRWLLRLTGPRIISGMAARHRQLGIDDAVLDKAFAQIQRALSDGAALTRSQLQPVLPTTEFPQQGQVVGHLLLLAQLHGLLASGPARGGEHSYLLLDDVADQDEPLPRPEAVVRLVVRFIAGRGPSAVRDIRRWCVLGKNEVVAALRDSGLCHEVVGGVELWWLPGAPPQGDCRGAWLLPMYDEAYASHDECRFPRVSEHPMGHIHIEGAGAGHGVVVVDGKDLGRFVLTGPGGRKRLELQLSSEVSRTVGQRAQSAARRLARFASAEQVDARR